MKRHYLIGVCVLLLAEPTLFAHDVDMECKQQKGTNKVTVTALFDDDSPAIRAKVEVLDAQKKLIAKGKTDAKGVWSFAAPEPGPYRVILNAGFGHLAEKNITVLDWQTEPETASDEIPIHEGLSRTESAPYLFWLKIGFALGVIALFSAAVLIARRLWSMGAPG